MNGFAEAPRRVVVTGVGMLSPLGDSPQALLEALCAGRSGLRPIEGFPTDGLPQAPAGELAFEPRQYLPKGNLRPLDRTGRLATAAAQLALTRAGISEEMRQEKKAGLVLGTMYGSVHTISAFDGRALEAGPKYVKPFDFANSVINAAAGQTAIWHGLPGINSTVTGGPSAGLQALAYAVDAIRGGRADLLLAGGAEELCFESYLACVRAGLLAGSRNGGPPRSVPYDAASNGFALGEGTALLVLEELESAQARGADILAELRGHATTFDVSRGEDSAVAARAVERTVALALEDAAADPAAVAAVSVSATGRLHADLYEAAGIVAALGRSDVPVCAVKGQLGESMGAGGAFQTVTLLAALTAGTLPGITGLSQVTKACPFEHLSAEPRPMATTGGGIGLVTSVALDGNVSTLVFDTALGTAPDTALDTKEATP